MRGADRIQVKRSVWFFGKGRWAPPGKGRGPTAQPVGVGEASAGEETEPATCQRWSLKLRLLAAEAARQSQSCCQGETTWVLRKKISRRLVAETEGVVAGSDSDTWCTLQLRQQKQQPLQPKRRRRSRPKVKAKESVAFWCRVPLPQGRLKCNTELNDAQQNLQHPDPGRVPQAKAKSDPQEAKVPFTAGRSKPSLTQKG